jgi:hydrogenase nickel incorporation protein HypA/HybF
MHELSIVSSVLDQLAELQKQHAGARFSKVGLRVGELAGVDVECLRFGFDCIVKDTEWAALALEIEEVARRQRCSRCGHEFKAGNWAADVTTTGDPLAMPFTACPECGEAATVTIAGEELQIAYVEVETSEVETSEVEDE